MTRVITGDDLLLLARLEIDGIEPANNLVGGNDLFLIRGNFLGYWTEKEKVVLEPRYFEIQRFGDRLKVGKMISKNGKQHVFYGAYSISKKKICNSNRTYAQSVLEDLYAQVN